MKPTRDIFNAFYRKHVRLVYATALAQGVDPATAEDVTQETFVRAWKHLTNILCHDLPQQRAWLMTTARHAAYSARKKRPQVCDDAWSEGEAGLVVGTETSATMRVDIQRALAMLDEEDRAMVVLRYFSECNSREIGEILDLPEGTVRRRLATCRQKLARVLAGWGNDDPEEEATT